MRRGRRRRPLRLLAIDDVVEEAAEVVEAVRLLDRLVGQVDDERDAVRLVEAAALIDLEAEHRHGLAVRQRQRTVAVAGPRDRAVVAAGHVLADFLLQRAAAGRVRLVHPDPDVLSRPEAAVVDPR